MASSTYFLKPCSTSLSDTGRRFQADRRDLYSEIQNFPQDQAVVARQLLPDVSTLKVSPKRTKNLDFKVREGGVMDGIGMPNMPCILHEQGHGHQQLNGFKVQSVIL